MQHGTCAPSGFASPFPRRRTVPAFLLTGLLTLASLASAQSPQDVDGPLHPNPDVSASHGFDNDAIVRMVKAGLAEDLILQTVRTQLGHYDLSADGLIALHQAGVPDAVISVMQAKTSGFAVREPRSGMTRLGAPTLTRAVPGPLTPALEEHGVYYKDKDGSWTPLKTEKATEVSGGFIKSTLTHGIISKDMNGEVSGARSPLVLEKGMQILIYTPSGVDATEYDLVQFREKKDRREFRAMTGGVIHSRSGAKRDEVEFNPERIGPQLYTFTIPADFVKGEYGVLPPGLNVSKVFTFSLRE